MPNQSLVDLTERTATANTDLIHVNSGGSDYKQTKANFTSDLAKHVTWNTSSTLVSQIGSLPSGSFYGLIASYGHQTETGMPENANFFVTVQRHNASNTDVVAITRGTKPHVWRLGSDNTWIQDPTRDEITSLNNSLTNSSIGGASAITLDSSQSSADINNFRIVKNGKIIMVWAQIGSLNVTTGANTIGTIPSGYRPYTNVSYDGYMGAGSERGTAVRVAIDSSGVLRIYASATISSTLRGTMTYISA